MSIKNKLAILMLILASFVIFQSAISLIKSFSKKSETKIAIHDSILIKDLLLIGQNLVKEREIFDHVMFEPTEKISEKLEQLELINEEEKKDFQHMIQGVKTANFSNNESIINELKAHHDIFLKSREDFLNELNKDILKRDSKILNDMTPKISELIKITEKIRYLLEKEVNKIDPVIGRFSEIKHAIWIIYNCLSKEFAVLNFNIKMDKFLNENEIENIGKFDGKIDLSIETINKLVLGNPGIKVVKKIIDLKNGQLKNYTKMKNEILQAGMKGLNYPHVSKDFVAVKTEAVNEMEAILIILNNESKEYLNLLIKKSNHSILINGLLLLSSLLISLFAYYVINFKVSNRLAQISNVMNKLAEGDLQVEIPVVVSNDEIDQMVKSVEVFKLNAENKIKLEQEQQENEAKAEMASKKARHDLAEKFESSVQSILDVVSSCASEVGSGAKEMKEFINQSSEIVVTASNGATNANQNVKDVANAVKEMTETIREISSQLNLSNGKISDSVKQAEAADHHAENLSKASGEVQEVIGLISEISSQINLLALNATIESARAGEAGKGFAVVAGEVKNLAGQTDQSIQKIEQVISSMNLASSNIVESLSLIKESINNISESSGGISSAVEEQSVTMSEISKNMDLAFEGTNSISENLKSAHEITNNSQKHAEEFMHSGEKMLNETMNLQTQVKIFLDEIKS